jgi:predicted NBD/HSP70 family sugar kinase
MTEFAEPTQNEPIKKIPSKHLKPRGSNHVGMRQFNERTVLQNIRLHPNVSKADIARLTKLSTQTASVIIDALLEEGLLLRGEPLKGKVGQPSVPILLNPDGAFSIGINVGRSRTDVLLMDFVGKVRERISLRYKFPDPQTLFGDIGRCLAQIQDHLGPELASRLVGVGVAAPFWLGSWHEYWGTSVTEVEIWNHIDIKEQIEAITPLPVEFSRDTASACIAELVVGQGRSVRSFFYLYISTFIGGGLVIDSHLHTGLRGNAGAVGSLPLGIASAGQKPAQLLDTASLWSLEKIFEQHGLDRSAVYDARAMQEPWLPHTQNWLEVASQHIAFSVISTASILDIEGVIIDGLCDRSLLRGLLEGVHRAVQHYNWEGLYQPEILEGSIGADARAMGGALLPIYAHFAPDRDLFLKMGEEHKTPLEGKGNARGSRN